MNEAIIIAVIGMLAAPVAAFITWLANRKKNVGEIYSTLSDSAQTMVEAMQSTMETLHEELLSAQKKIDEMQKELVELRHQNTLLLEENHILHKKIDELTRTLGNRQESP